MKKDRIIKNVHRVLYVYEENILENYYVYLNYVIVLLNGLDEDETISESIILLNGLEKLKENVTRDTVRSIILHIMNEIDRRYKGE